MSNVEVYEVGHAQFLSWILSNSPTMRMADWEDCTDLGSYLVVSSCVLNGRCCMPVVNNSKRTLDQAVEYVDYYKAFLRDTCKGEDWRRFEVWHLVDDGELWDEWEEAVALSRFAYIPYIPSSGGYQVMCGHDVVATVTELPHHLFEVIRMYTGHNTYDYYTGGAAFGRALQQCEYDGGYVHDSLVRFSDDDDVRVRVLRGGIEVDTPPISIVQVWVWMTKEL